MGNMCECGSLDQDILLEKPQVIDDCKSLKKAKRYTPVSTAER